MKGLIQFLFRTVEKPAIRTINIHDVNNALSRRQFSTNGRKIKTARYPADIRWTLDSRQPNYGFWAQVARRLACNLPVVVVLVEVEFPDLGEVVPTLERLPSEL